VRTAGQVKSLIENLEKWAKRREAKNIDARYGYGQYPSPLRAAMEFLKEYQDLLSTANPTAVKSSEAKAKAKTEGATA
jgi:hypothetical protein